MITETEVTTLAAHLGVPEPQVLRDHLISHVLAALTQAPSTLRNTVTFFGGTALCRTWLPDLRLSEDIDLLVDTPTIGPQLTRALTRGLRREFPDHQWHHLDTRHDVATWELIAADLRVRTQLVQWRHGWQAIPTTPALVVLRYSDLPATAELTVPTPNGFAAMKLLAWFDRQTPRDLYDLAALADTGHIDHAAAGLVRQIAGFTPNPASFGTRLPPTVATAWHTELSHQMTITRSAADCHATVRAALARLDVQA